MLRALRHRNFLWYWLSAMAQSVSMGMQFLILGWLVLEETGSSSKLGIVVFLFGVPNLGFSILGGMIADRIDRRGLVILALLASAVLTLVIGVIGVRDQVEIWHIYGAAVILGTLQAVSTPARIAMVVDLVPREDFMSAVAVHSGVMNTGRIFGPALAGGIIELGGINVGLFITAGCYFLAPLCFALIRGVTQQSVVGKRAPAAESVGLLHHLATTPVALTVIVVAFAMALFPMPVTQVMPAFARDVLGSGAGGTGLLLTGMGVGSTVGSFALASLGDFRQKNWALIGGGITLGVSLLIFSLSPWYWVSWGLLLLAGVAVAIYASVGTTVLQLTATREVMGRVMGVWTLGGALVFVGALPLAVIADATNWNVALGGGATIFLVVLLLFGLWRPTLRQLDL